MSSGAAGQRAGARRPHALLLTGRPGVGKTTALRRAAAPLTGRRLGGFYTEEIREAGARRGFRAVTLDGWQRDLARVDFPGSPRVGPYGVDVGTVAALVERALRPDAAVDVYLVDEIGKMECLSPRFVAAMRALLDSSRPVIATIALRGGGFIAEVKAREDVEALEVTRANRDELPARILAWVRERS